MPRRERGGGVTSVASIVSAVVVLRNDAGGTSSLGLKTWHAKVNPVFFPPNTKIRCVSV